jgi:hypothetical protein
MLEFRLARHFSRNYNTIDESVGRKAVIAIPLMFTEVVGSVEVRRWRP